MTDCKTCFNDYDEKKIVEHLERPEDEDVFLRERFPDPSEEIHKIVTFNGAMQLCRQIYNVCTMNNCTVMTSANETITNVALSPDGVIYGKIEGGNHGYHWIPMTGRHLYRIERMELAKTIPCVSTVGKNVSSAKVREV